MATTDIVVEGNLNDLVAAIISRINEIKGSVTTNLIIGPTDPIPEGTPTNTVIFRTEV